MYLFIPGIKIQYMYIHYIFYVFDSIIFLASIIIIITKILYKEFEQRVLINILVVWLKFFISGWFWSCEQQHRGRNLTAVVHDAA